MKKMISFILMMLLVLFFMSDRKTRVEKRTWDSPKMLAGVQLPFIENVGQTAGHVRFYSQIGDGLVCLDRAGRIAYSFINHAGEGNRLCFEEQFLGGRIASLSGMEKTDAHVSHFIGSDRRRWRTQIPTYRSVTLGQVYDGIFINLKSHANNVEKLCIVQPGAEPETIRIQINGCASLQINDAKELVVETPQGRIAFTAPVAYQEIGGERTRVEVAYELADGSSQSNVYGFSVGDYDRSRTLVIDPLIAATFLGGGKTEGMNYTNTQVVAAGDGDVYVAGCTQSPDFPALADSYQNSLRAGSDGFVARFNRALTELKQVTFFGGDALDEISSMRLAGDGSLYVAGNTESTDLPTTESAYQRVYKGGEFNYYGSGDAFIARFDSNLQTLLASTYIGGSKAEYCASLALDKAGHVFISGATTSNDFPFTASAFQKTHKVGGQLGEDVYVSKLSGDLTQLLASSYIGGSGDDLAEELAVMPSGSVVLVGWVTSADYPTTANGYDRSFGAGGYDAFVTKIDNDLGSLLSSTYLGGSNWDFGYALTLDSACNVYVTGHTASTNFPTSASAFDLTYSGSGGQNIGDDLFISKFDSSLSALSASTYLGGEAWEIGYCLMTDAQGAVYVAGTTSSAEFPTVAHAYDSTYNGGTKYTGDAFISRLDGNLSSLVASTYLGGSESEGVGGMCLGGDGSVWLAGSTTSGDFPASYSAYDKSYNDGAGDAFLARLDANLSRDLVTSGFYMTPQTGHMPLTVQFTDASTSVAPITSWLWDFDHDGVVDSDEKNPTWTYQEAGQFIVTLLVSDGVNSDIVEMESAIHVFDGESALWFDGLNSKGACAATASLNLMDALTIEAKISPSGWGETAGLGLGRIIDKKNIQLYVVGEHPSFSDHSLALQLTHADGTTSMSITEANSISLDTWQHIAVSYDANSNQVRMYINGVEQSLFQTRTPSGSIKDNSADVLYIGNNATTTNTFHGAIDDVRLWNVVRSKEQIQQQINAYLRGDENGLLAYWKMNEGFGDSLGDGSGHANEIALTGTEWIQGPGLNLPTGVAPFGSDETSARNYLLLNNYPNPFNPETTIRFDLPLASDVAIHIYNIAGAKVRTLLVSPEQAGIHSIVWDGKNDAGVVVSSGVYLCELRANSLHCVKKMAIVK
ncbi:MAG: LamG-like jellyroll fold domain-containing protein [Candidatus Zhuqueibacterota bacterium]